MGLFGGLEANPKRDFVDGATEWRGAATGSVEAAGVDLALEGGSFDSSGSFLTSGSWSSGACFAFVSCGLEVTAGVGAVVAGALPNENPVAGFEMLGDENEDVPKLNPSEGVAVGGLVVEAAAADPKIEIEAGVGVAADDADGVVLVLPSPNPPNPNADPPELNADAAGVEGLSVAALSAAATAAATFS